ncbi:MAG: ATP-binding protein [Steroidobacteraceae bacterium]|jgi:signal transduction histidine kinase|nr:ATP-binding protein [Steroidobacteraceae bacterium]
MADFEDYDGALARPRDDAAPADAPTPRERALLDAIPANAALVGHDATILAVNAAWRRFAHDNGWHDPAGVGLNYRRVCAAAGDDPHAVAAREGLDAVLAGSLHSFERDYPCDAPGAARWFHLLIAPYGEDSSRGAVVMHFDVTQARRLAEALQQAQKMETVGRMTSGLSHDFNNVLQVLVTNLKVLERWPATAAQREHLATAMDAARRAEELIRRLLDFARRRAREPELAAATEVVHGLEPMLRQVLGRDTVLELRYADGGAFTWLDRHRLEMAVLNLAVNARDAMHDHGRLEITVDSRRLDASAGAAVGLQAGPYVRIAVQDSGPGVPAELRSRVFEPFFTTRPGDGGTGLGLTMVREFARGAGGDVVLEPSASGARFVLWLPAAADPAAPH